MSEGDGEHLAFIVGCPRSGTTWLEQLVTSHPDTTPFPGGESRIFGSMEPLWDQREREGRTEEEVADACRRFLDRVLEAARARSERSAAQVLVEKTPGHVMLLPFVRAVYPRAAVIHIVRDGRDVARSLLEYEHGPNDLAACAAARACTIGAARAEATAGTRLLTVRYEDLVADPEAGLATVFEWLGLPVDDAVLDEVGARAGVRVSQHNTTGDVGPGKWQSLSAEDLATIIASAGPELVAEGYLSDG